MFQFSISLNVCRYVSGIDGKKVAILMAFVFFMLIECNCLYGQDVVASQLNLPSLNILSPQTAEFVKHGNTPVSYFTGEANIRVPVYTYSDNDFELPIYLAYNSSGFNPNKRESIVGLNFFLNVGGAITRQVKGVPDERQGILSVSLRELHGGFYGLQK